MQENITKKDINKVIDFLSQKNIPKLTNGEKVKKFESRWGKWLGTKFNVMVNSGSAANELTMLALNYLYGNGEIIVPPLTWVSDINSVIFSGFKPVFCDINMNNLSFDIEKLKNVITKDTKAIFLTHVLGINGITEEILDLCEKNNILLIEDVCESHGATYKGKKVGNFGFASNFSFYFAHHMSTIEGGMISTNDERFYQICLSLRSHGMVREMTDEKLKKSIIDTNKDLNKDFIFIHPAHNFRSTEINAVLGLSQLKKLDLNNHKRIENFNYFMKNLNSKKYHTDINLEGQSSYAFIVIMKNGTIEKRDELEKILNENNIEYRRGLSGGGNQLRQPYIKNNFNINLDDFKNVDYIHNFSWYIGNYPSIQIKKINYLLKLLNEQ